MTGLPYVAENIKSLIKWSGIVVAGLFGLWLLWLSVLFIFGIFFPPPSGEPDLAFGRIPQPFVYNSSLAPNLFSLDTPGGKIESPVSQLPIYAIPTNEGEFASLDNAKAKAKNGGLDSDPTKLSANEWRWTNKRVPNKSLVFNIVTNNFVYHYDWVADSSPLEGVFKTTEETITDKARSFLNDFKSLKPDIKKGSTKVTYWKLSGADRQQVGSFSEANAVRVEFFRDKVDGKFNLTETDPKVAQINVLIGPNINPGKQLLEINYKYWNYDTSKIATYPIREGLDAYKDLKKGKTLIALGQNKSFDSISITKVSLAYFNPSVDQRYLQPIFVFEGSGRVAGERQDFVAYVQAITTDNQR